MASLSIRKFPDPILRKKAAKVDKIGRAEKNILANMADTMYLANGVGLAAVQVGVDQQLAVIDVGGGLIKMANPVIVRKDGQRRESHEEGCLSLPELCVNVKRAKKVVVSYLSEDGDVKLIEAEGLLARAFQHEIDHLAGVLILDYMNPVKQVFAKRSLSKKRSNRTPLYKARKP